MKERNDKGYRYKDARGDMSREKASELLESITPERLERIENNKFTPTPAEVLLMAEKYKTPELCNYYCVNQCEIGAKYVPEVRIGTISDIVLKVLDSLNEVNKEKDKMVHITVDGIISDDEIEDFIGIQNELERISLAVDELKLWVERMKSTGQINMELYKKYKG